ncbi:hypothetical protein [Janibacter sp. DB-40]|uniref:alpha/beta hydrolase n=1 Tax=Janibacter sp. DB-40 TaxID=3028808 RepID=UPI00240607A7|nr:hypothetical protein [Janibacter sp. DB-40]
MGASIHEHVLVPATGEGHLPLLLLHGTDGSETELLPLADRLSPATKLSVRGTVDLPGGHAFFRRHPDRRVDEEDLRARVPLLREFLLDNRRELGDTRPVAVGFSNGAIMATALMMCHPDLLAGAVLLRPLAPFARPPVADLTGVRVLLLDGEHDQRRQRGDGLRLAQEFRRMGADVTHDVLPVAHEITEQDERLARHWLRTPC